jgi:hypothetical protein
MDMGYMMKPNCTKELPRADLVMRNPIHGKNYLVDLTFPIINANATLENPITRVAADGKTAFYESYFNYKPKFVLVPGPFDSYGRMGEQLKAL